MSRAIEFMALVVLLYAAFAGYQMIGEPLETALYGGPF